MDRLIRFGVSLERELLARFDRRARRRGTQPLEAIGDLVRALPSWRTNGRRGEVIGS